MDTEQILIVALGGRVLGIHASTGQELWRNELQLGGISEVALAVSANFVFASASAKRVFCIDKQNGETKWTALTTGIGRATLIQKNDKLIVCKGGWLDAFTTEGKTLWSMNLRESSKDAAALGFTDHVIQSDRYRK